MSWPAFLICFWLAGRGRPASADGDAAAYPVTVATKFGDFTVEEAPRRVVNWPPKVGLV